MGHADPLIAIPVGVFFAAMSVLLVVDPGRFHDVVGWPRTLTRLLGPTGANVVLRACGLFTAVLFSGLVVHATLGVLGL